MVIELNTQMKCFYASMLILAFTPSWNSVTPINSFIHFVPGGDVDICPWKKECVAFTDKWEISRKNQNKWDLINTEASIWDTKGLMNCLLSMK